MEEQKHKKRKWLKWVLLIVAILIAFLMLDHFIINPNKNLTKNSESEDQPLITANFVDIENIARITKFRSCQGHLVIPQDGSQPRSNMKHYFYLKENVKKSPRQVKLYAPFDGYINRIFEQKGEEHEKGSSDITISKNKGFASRNDWGLTLLHAIPKEGLKEGSEVRAGELIGYSALDFPPYFSFDVVYGKTATFPKKIDGWNSPYAALDSVFNHMSDEVFKEYQAAFSEINSKDDFIISLEARSANPCKYEGSGPRFDPSADKINEMIGKLEGI